MKAPEQNGGRIPFNFGPHPRALEWALRGGALTLIEYGVLSVLYARANRSTWATTVTLEQLAEEARWSLTTDSLYRLLVGLKRRGWIDYPTKPGVKRPVYAIRLIYDRPEGSEDGPSTESATAPNTERAGNGVATHPPVPPPASVSEHDYEWEAMAGPSTTPPGPSTEQASTPLAERDPSPPEPEPVRAPRDVRERDNPSVTERLKENVSVYPDHKTVEGDGTPGPDETDKDSLTALIERARRAQRDSRTNGLPQGYVWPSPHAGDKPDEEGLLADVEFLVDAGLAVWIDDMNELEEPE